MKPNSTGTRLGAALATALSPTMVLAHGGHEPIGTHLHLGGAISSMGITALGIGALVTAVGVARAGRARRAR